MFSKLSTLSLSLGLLALSTHVNAHCAIVPMLGVTGTAARSDVQQPSTAKPCGSVNVASTLDSSTAVQAAADGTFTVNATDFNAGADGSRSVTAKVDPTAAGKTFSTAVTVSQNGNAAPTTVGTDQIVASLPSGTTCSGGTSGNLCLVQFTTTAGFGNCVVVAQGAGTAAATNGTAATTTNGTAASTTGTTATNGTDTTATTNGTTTDSTTTTTNTTTTDGTATDGTTTNGTAATGSTTTTGTASKHHKHKHAGAAAAGNAAAGDAAAGTAAAGNAAAGDAAAGDADCGDAAAGNAATGNAATADLKAGTRAPRALLRSLETRGEEALGVVRRGVLGWMWA